VAETVCHLPLIPEACVHPRPVCVIFVVDKVVLEQVYSWVLLLSPVRVILPLLCTYLYLDVILTRRAKRWWLGMSKRQPCCKSQGAYFHFFFRPHKTWQCNRIFSENVDLAPSLSFHQCFILVLILLLLYQKGELVKPGHLKAMLFPKITEHWIEKSFHFFSHRPCHGWDC